MMGPPRVVRWVALGDSYTIGTSVAPGDHVVTLFSPQCRECVHCRSSRTNLCLAIREQQNKGYLPDGTTRLSRDGEPVRHFMGTSTFAEYTVMPEIALAKVTPEAPLEGACLFACGLSTGIGAAINTARVQPGSTCVVFGAGMSLISPAFSGYILGRVDADRRGAAFGAWIAAMDTGIGSGSILLGWVIERAGFGAGFGLGAGMAVLGWPAFVAAERLLSRAASRRPSPGRSAS